MPLNKDAKLNLNLSYSFVFRQDMFKRDLKNVMCGCSDSDSRIALPHCIIRKNNLMQFDTFIVSIW